VVVNAKMRLLHQAFPSKSASRTAVRQAFNGRLRASFAKSGLMSLGKSAVLQYSANLLCSRARDSMV
jgi:hypothetical protein